jgi:hypothetical protein
VTDKSDRIETIKKIMRRTTANGCSEAEALQALDTVRALMDAYDISEAELALSKEEKAILRSEPEANDPHNIKAYLAHAVAEFCGCRGWRGPNGIIFCGLPADARLASWLLDHLNAFIQRELTAHLIGCLAPKSERRFVINGFVGGITDRINERLDALRQRSATAATGNGRALVVVKDAAVKAKMEAEGICLRKTYSRRRSDEGARAAGAAAGERASFGRPVTGRGAVPRLN